MKKPIFWEKAKRELSNKDKALGKIIQNYTKDYILSKSDPFYTLARSIVGQPISLTASQPVRERYERKIKKVNPKNTRIMHFQSLKACGLSRQKSSYLKSLSTAFIEKEINTTKWIDHSDEKIIEELIKIKGIGRWTAEMFLIFNLCKPDIFPADDLGLIKGICECYNLSYPITKEHAIKLSEKWKPWRSVATWYFWRSLDPIPVEY